MSSYFIYDSINQYRSDATISEGTFATDTFTVSSIALTAHERSADQNIGTAITGISVNDAVCYQVGSSVSADAVAVYFNGSDGVTANNDEMTIYTGTAIDDLSSSGNFGSTDSGWIVKTFTEVTSKNKFCIEFNEAITNVAEILVGKKLAFEVEPDMNVQTTKDYGTTVQRSIGGVEYSINTHDGIDQITLSFQNISSTFKDSLNTMMDAIKGSNKKFLYNDGSDFYWMRMVSGLKFNEVASDRFSTQITMSKQLQ
jgi:hypothetical protein